MLHRDIAFRPMVSSSLKADLVIWIQVLVRVDHCVVRGVKVENSVNSKPSAPDS